MPHWSALTASAFPGVRDSSCAASAVPLLTEDPTAKAWPHPWLLWLFLLGSGKVPCNRSWALLSPEFDQRDEIIQHGSQGLNNLRVNRRQGTGKTQQINCLLFLFLTESSGFTGPIQGRRIWPNNQLLFSRSYGHLGNRISFIYLLYSLPASVSIPPHSCQPGTVPSNKTL